MPVVSGFVEVLKKFIGEAENSRFLVTILLISVRYHLKQITAIYIA